MFHELTEAKQFSPSGAEFGPTPVHSLSATSWTQKTEQMLNSACEDGLISFW